MNTSLSSPFERLRKYARLLPWLILLAEYLWLVFYFWRFGQTLVNADMASEMVLANLMNKRGDFVLCRDWYYSSELRVLNVQLVYRLGLALFGDWHAARTFSIALTILLLLGSWFCLAREARLPRLGVWAGMMMLCPFSGYYNWLFLIGLYYIPHAALSFLSLALALSLSRRRKKGSRMGGIVTAAALTLLALAAGLGGVRQLLACYLPLLMAAAFLYLKKLFSLSAPELKDAFHNRETAFLLAVLLCCAGAFAGYLINVKVLTKTYTFYNYNNTVLSDLSLEGFLKTYGNAAQLFGYRAGSEALSVPGIQSLLAALWLGVIPLALIAGLRLGNALGFEKRVLLWAAAAMLLSGVFINTLSDMNDPRYLLTALVFGLGAVSVTMEAYPFRNLAAKGVCILALLVLLAAPYLAPDFSMYYGDRSGELLQAADWLKRNGYERGYATYWNANPVTEFTDGAVEMWTFDQGHWHGEANPLTVNAWLQQRYHMYSYPDGPVFVLLSEEEAAARPGYAREDKQVYRENGYAVFAYESATELYGSVGIEILVD